MVWSTQFSKTGAFTPKTCGDSRREPWNGRGKAERSSDLFGQTTWGGGVTRTSQELQRDVAILIKQSDDLKVFARELAKAADKVRADAEELRTVIGKSKRRKARWHILRRRSSVSKRSPVVAGVIRPVATRPKTIEDVRTIALFYAAFVYAACLSLPVE
jgi:hypothetical protein